MISCRRPRTARRTSTSTSPRGWAAAKARRGGCVSLISSGTSDKESAFLEATPSGNDVFFLTAAQLLAPGHRHGRLTSTTRASARRHRPCLTARAPAPPGCSTATRAAARAPAPAGPGRAVGHRDVLRPGQLVPAAAAKQERLGDESRATQTADASPEARESAEGLQEAQESRRSAARAKRKARKTVRAEAADKTRSAKQSTHASARGSRRAHGDAMSPTSERALRIKWHVAPAVLAATASRRRRGSRSRRPALAAGAVVAGQLRSGADAICRPAGKARSSWP